MVTQRLLVLLVLELELVLVLVLVLVLELVRVILSTPTTPLHPLLHHTNPRRLTRSVKATLSRRSSWLVTN